MTDTTEQTMFIRGLGELTVSEWERLSPSSESTLIPVPNHLPILLGGVPYEEEMWHLGKSVYGKGFIKDLYSIGDEDAIDSVREELTTMYGYSTEYGPDRVDIRVDLYGGGVYCHPDIQHVMLPIADGPIDFEALRTLIGFSVAVYDAWTHPDDPCRVAVTCQAGLNRSSLFLGFLLLQAGLSGREAVTLIREQRSSLCLVNEMFEDILLNLDRFVLDTVAEIREEAA